MIHRHFGQISDELIFPRVAALRNVDVTKAPATGTCYQVGGVEGSKEGP